MQVDNDVPQNLLRPIRVGAAWFQLAATKTTSQSGRED